MHHVECGDGHQAVGDTGQPAQSSGERRRNPGCAQTSRRAGGNQEKTPSGRCFPQSAIEKEERAGIKQQVISADMNKREGQRTPPVAGQKPVGQKNERLTDAAEQQHKVGGDQKRDESRYLRISLLFCDHVSISMLHINSRS
jgi:hypothetical protein